ncbi:MAG: hypothetical protein NUV54_02390 [Candidatus Taylorbacteria bacterium]|nr:hypothetical protein [Candidatus Taylorbacteria bacterium]
MEEYFKKKSALYPKWRKVVGVTLIVIGFIALVTPFTPGSWLMFVGLEVLGFDLVFWTKIKGWFKKKYKTPPAES